MNRILLFLTAFLLANYGIFAQKIKIYGYIIDKNSKEKLLSAYVRTVNDNVVLTNEFGFYSIVVDLSKSKELVYSYIGYKDTVLKIDFQENKRIDIALAPNIDLGQIVVEGKKKENIGYNNTITSKQIKLTPHILGEKDIMKNFQLLPGVQFGIDGTADLYVRGGTPDQNTILIDDIPIYFTNHFGSFFSIFDENSINSAKIYKYGFPAKYGSTISSLIDIRTKDGNMKKTEGEISVGLVSSKISINGPILKDKLSYIFNFRVCNYFFPSYIIKLLNTSSYQKYVYYFVDFNLKFNYIVTKKDKIDYTLYRGFDKNQILYDYQSLSDNQRDDRELNNTWGNWLSSFRWTHSYNNFLFQKFVVGYTSFDNKNLNSKLMYEAKQLTYKELIQSNSNIGSIIAKLNWELFVTNSVTLNFGVFFNKPIFIPHNESILIENYSIDSTSLNMTMGRFSPSEGSFYVDFQKKFKSFAVYLSYLYNLYQNDTLYKNMMYSARFEFYLSKTSKLSISYDKSFQNKHLLCNYSVFSPNSIWLPADSLFLPQSSHQFNINYTYFNKNIEISLSPFAKFQNNLIDYNHSSFSNDTSSNVFLNSIMKGGTGEIFGFEAMLNFYFKKIYLQASYTYMKNYRRFMDYKQNKAYPFIFDRRHFVQIFMSYKVTKSFSINANFIFGTGYPLKAPVLIYKPARENEPTHNFSNYLSNIYSFDYQFESDYLSGVSVPRTIYITPGIVDEPRLPDYHRLDISFVWSKEKKFGTRTWSVDIYNTYNHLNTIFLIGYIENNTPIIKKFVLFPILPSISYRYKF